MKYQLDNQTLKPMLVEILGKATGYCKGKGGSMHIASLEL
jgi:TPP-dependent pyruvate/acetoin dehydrogenase alpha subunit